MFSKCLRLWHFDICNQVVEVTRTGKSLLRTSESSRFLNSAIFWCFEKHLFWVESWNIRLNFSTFSEAVKASRCYFFENWLMKHKWVTLVIIQAVIYHRNSQCFYPSEPFQKNHITMRHPVIQMFQLDSLSIKLKSYWVINTNGIPILRNPIFLS